VPVPAPGPCLARRRDRRIRAPVEAATAGADAQARDAARWPEHLDAAPQVRRPGGLDDLVWVLTRQVNGRFLNRKTYSSGWIVTKMES
jgi:hypothetical protein